jgi:AraC family transcriptional regulator
MNETPQLRTLPAQPAAVVRQTTTPAELAGDLGQLLERVLQHAISAGAAPAGPPFTRYLRMDDHSVEIETGFPLDRAVPGGDGVQAVELPATDAVVARHIGPYDQLPATYAAATTFAGQLGRSPSEAPWEVYLTDPGEQPDPARWVTEVYLPVR